MHFRLDECIWFSVVKPQNRFSDRRFARTSTVQLDVVVVLGIFDQLDCSSARALSVCQSLKQSKGLTATDWRFPHTLAMPSPFAQQQCIPNSETESCTYFSSPYMQAAILFLNTRFLNVTALQHVYLCCEICFSDLRSYRKRMPYK
jgi:hypothetical protein